MHKEATCRSSYVPLAANGTGILIRLRLGEGSNKCRWSVCVESLFLDCRSDADIQLGCLERSLVDSALATKPLLVGFLFGAFRYGVGKIHYQLNTVQM